MRLCLLTLIPIFLVAACESKPDKDLPVRGKAHLSVELQSMLKPTATLFVITRRPGELIGPPLSVTRFGPPLRFPVDFSIQTQERITVMARVSQSGAATPVSAGDVEGFAIASFVPAGTQGVDIQLDQVRR